MKYRKSYVKKYGRYNKGSKKRTNRYGVNGRMKAKKMYTYKNSRGGIRM